LDLENISSYIERTFGEDSVIDFKSKIIESISLLQEFPQLGSIQNQDKGFRGFVIHRNTKVFYKFIDQQVTILRFFDNRQKPSS
jgi:plasmid stabilization system protein ParE